jgi:hypothetical protein
MHHLLAHCDCYIGESATMASEAVILGVPAVYAADDNRGYTDDLSARGLLWKVPDVDPDALVRAVQAIEELDRENWQHRINQYRSTTTDLAQQVVEATLQHGGAGQRYK